MGRWWWSKFLLVSFLTLFSIAYIYPTWKGGDFKESSYPFHRQLTLGLDLQGGLYLVMGVDFDQIFESVLERRVKALVTTLQEEAGVTAEQRPSESGLSTDEDPRVQITFDEKQSERVYELYKEGTFDLRLTQDTPGVYEFGLNHVFRGEVRTRTIDQSIEVIRNRIDQFGVTEPQITRQGTDRIVVELPGNKEIERAKNLIGQTARLEFKIVDQNAADPNQLREAIREAAR